MRIEHLMFIIPVILVVLGGGGIIAGIWIILKAYASSKWPSCQGTITSSEVDMEKTARHRTETFTAKVAFEYQVRGKSYSASRISFFEYGSSNPDHATRRVARYPTGRSVRVYYNPKNPKTAVLEPGARLMSYCVLGFGIALAGIGVVLLLCLTQGDAPT